jgi:ABC-type branched-subunit amino acid transport system substrate-binding protein
MRNISNPKWRFAPSGIVPPWLANILVLLAFALTLRGGEANPGSPAEIVLGMSTALSGPSATLGKDMHDGVLAGLERVNRAGGVNGRKLRLIALDDGYVPSRTAPNMRQLIEREHVLAVIGNVGTPTAVVAMPIAAEHKTLFFAAGTGGGALRKTPPDRYVINYRASYAEEMETIVGGLIDELHLQPQQIAFFTQRDSYGDAGFYAGIAALKRRGLMNTRAVSHVRYERGSLAVEKAVASLILARQPPRAVVMVGAYASCARFIQVCKETGLHALFVNVSFVGSVPLAQALGKTEAPVVVTQVVPALYSNLPIVSDFSADVGEADLTVSPNKLEGYIAARILTMALERIPGEPTREAIVDALEGLGEFDLGLGSALQLSPKEHQASHRVWSTVLREGVFVPFRWQDASGLLQEGGTHE